MRPGRVNYLEGLGGIAAMQVVLLHFVTGFLPDTAQHAWPPLPRAARRSHPMSDRRLIGAGTARVSARKVSIALGRLTVAAGLVVCAAPAEGAPPPPGS